MDKDKPPSLHPDQTVLDLRQPASIARSHVVLPLEGGGGGQGEIEQLLDLAAQAHVKTFRHPIHDVVESQSPAVADLVDELFA